MKFQKLLVNAAAIGLLAAGPGAAMAVDCSAGVIQDRIVDSVEVSGRPCVIIGSRIIGGVRVDSSPAILMVENDVGEGILVRDSGTVAIVNNRVTNLNRQAVDQARAADPFQLGRWAIADRFQQLGGD